MRGRRNWSLHKVLFVPVDLHISNFCICKLTVPHLLNDQMVWDLTSVWYCISILRATVSLVRNEMAWEFLRHGHIAIVCHFRMPMNWEGMSIQQVCAGQCVVLLVNNYWFVDVPIVPLALKSQLHFPNGIGSSTVHEITVSKDIKFMFRHHLKTLATHFALNSLTSYRKQLKSLQRGCGLWVLLTLSLVILCLVITVYTMMIRAEQA